MIKILNKNESSRLSVLVGITAIGFAFVSIVGLGDSPYRFMYELGMIGIISCMIFCIGIGICFKEENKPFQGNVSEWELQN